MYFVFRVFNFVRQENQKNHERTEFILIAKKKHKN